MTIEEREHFTKDIKQQVDYLLEDLGDFATYNDIDKNWVITTFLDILHSDTRLNTNITGNEIPATEKQIAFVRSIHDMLGYYFDFEHATKRKATLYIDTYVEEFNKKRNLQRQLDKQLKKRKNHNSYTVPMFEVANYYND